MKEVSDLVRDLIIELYYQQTSYTKNLEKKMEKRC